MIFLIRFIYRAIATNPGKILFLIGGFGAWFINANYIEVEYTYNERVLTQFEVHGNNFVVIEDDGRENNFKTEKLSSEIIFTEDGKEVIQTGTNGWFYGLWVISAVCWAIVVFSPIEEDCHWELSDVYDECMIRGVKVDREGTKLYYHYRGKILEVFDTGDPEMYNGKGLNKRRVVDLIRTYRKSPNLYEKYQGTKSKIRENKIDNLFPNA